MKSLLLGFLLLLPDLAHAGSLQDYLAKMAATIEKDGRALFCVAQVPTGSREEQQMLWPKSATCIGEVQLGQGMSQRSGCAAFRLNVFDLTTTGVGTDGRNKIVEGKKCSDALGQLMGLNLVGYVDEPAGKDKDGNDNMAVGWLFYDGTRVDWMKPAVVYSQNSTLGGLMHQKTPYEAWFEKARAQYLAGQAKLQKRSTASGGADGK